MPYHIVASQGGYFVENKDTKRRYSLHPLPLVTAKKQLAALQIRAPDKK
jgi:hypothetical protein